MAQFKLLGRVEPSYMQISLGLTPEIGYKIEEAGIELKCSILIERSIVVASCRTNRFGDDVLAWVLPYVFDWVSAGVDLMSFSLATALTVQIDGAELPDGSRTRLVGTAPDLVELANACEVTEDAGVWHVELKDALRISLTEPTLMLALRDLGASLRYGNNSIVYCARSVEALREALCGNDIDRGRAWEHFRETLHVSKGYLQFVTAASRGPRHGSSAYISSETRQEIFRRSWVVMNRFLVYRLGDNQPLSEAEFPWL